MAMVTFPSSRTLGVDGNYNDSLRDASFSSHLNGVEDTSVSKLADSSRKLSPMINPREKHPCNMGKEKEEDEEIGVFGAEKYFNGGIDEDSPRITKLDRRSYRYVEVEGVSPGPVRPKLQPGTPGGYSESSWNSQSALLRTAVRNPSPRKANNAKGKSFLSGFRCKCYCSDKDSVDVDEHVGKISFKTAADSGVLPGKMTTKSPINTVLDSVEGVQVNRPCMESWKEDLSLGRENCFAFPTISPGLGNRNLPLKTKFMEEEEIPRKSLEVFGSPVMDKRSKTPSLERRLTMLSWSATPTIQEHAFSGVNHKDSDSDASSDLFEIDSLTGKPNRFLARQTSDATSGCVSPACYAPSEESIEWSVVTASAADFSAMSDYEELRSSTTVTSPVRSLSTNPVARIRANKETQRQRPGGLLGCKSQKAVRVAGDVYRTSKDANYDPRVRLPSESFTVPRFPAQSTLSGSTNRLANRAIPRSHSPRAAHLLYIQ